MSAIWALVADESRARVFARLDTGLPLQDIDDILPGNGELKNDNSQQNERTPAAFARKLAAYLAEARKSGQYESLYLIAPQEFCERLQAELDSSTRKKLKKSFGENLAIMRAPEIRDRLAKLIK